ncbi:MAG TPA: methyltransferase domain-containing protein [Gemmatimonadaceae bacterium]|jgi:2-polyprenyl-3-methyl-5-hydroxy-6-metoxy-1,4-benzoquinol methylase
MANADPATEPCPLCASVDTHVEYRLTGYRIASCAGCGFEFHDEFQGGGGDKEMFSADYYRVRHREAFDRQFDDYSRDPSVRVYRHWLERIESRIPVGRILDVGSALGTFLKIAEGRGWSPQGVEISQFAADFSRESRGLSVFNGDLEAFSSPEGAFDAVTFWDSLEHVTQPLQNLRTAVRRLRKGGLILITTDNFDCLVADVARGIYRATLGNVRYPMERVFIAANRSYFTEATLRALLMSCGLRVVVLEKMEYPIDKIRTNVAERAILTAFYGGAKLLHREAQVTVLAEKA